MTETVIPLHITSALLEDVEQEAVRSGISIERWFLDLAAERIRDKVVTERFFSRVPLPSDGQALVDILKSVPNNPASLGDEL